MGLFDYITVHFPLPSAPKPPATRTFQTKDTSAQYMERYTISADGRLIHHTESYETIPDAERSHPGAIMRRRASGDVVVPLEWDQIDFCHYDAETRESWDYRARFTDGLCEAIRCLDYRVLDA